MTTRKITIEIETANDAFQDEPGIEIASILRKLANKIEFRDEAKWNLDMPDTGPLVDYNGNKVGTWSIV